MGKSARIRRLIQKIAIVLAVILALPQMPMAQRIGLGYVEAHAEPEPEGEKSDPYIYITSTVCGSKLIITPGSALFGGAVPPTGNMHYDYAYVNYDEETNQYSECSEYSSMSDDEKTVSDTLVWDIPEVAVGKMIGIRYSYSGDDNYYSYPDEENEIDFGFDYILICPPEISSVSEVVRDDDTYSLSFVRNKMMCEASNYYYLLKAYDSGESLSSKDLVDQVNALYENHSDDNNTYFGYGDIEWNDSEAEVQTINIEIDGENFNEGFYVIELVTSDWIGGLSISEKKTSAVFHTPLTFTADDIEATCAEGLVYQGSDFTPSVTLIPIGETGIRKDTVATWLAKTDNQITYSFKQTMKWDETPVTDTVTGSAITCPGFFEIYASSTYDGNSIANESLGTVYVAKEDTTPVITGVADNTKYFNAVEITVSDDNLSSVTLKKDSGTPVEKEIVDFSLSTFTVTELGDEAST